MHHIVDNNIIDEDEPTEDEVKLYQEYKDTEEEKIPLENIIRQLNLDEE